MRKIIWVNLALGLWLVVAPFVGDSGASASTTLSNDVVLVLLNDVVLGVALVASSWWIVGGMAGGPGVGGFEALCGLWLIAAPFVLRYRALWFATTNDVAVGVAVLIVGSIATRALLRGRVRVA